MGQNWLAPAICSYDQVGGPKGESYTKLKFFPVRFLRQVFVFPLGRFDLALAVCDISVELHSLMRDLGEFILAINKKQSFGKVPLLLQFVLSQHLQLVSSLVERVELVSDFPGPLLGMLGEQGSVPKDFASSLVHPTMVSTTLSRRGDYTFIASLDASTNPESAGTSSTLGRSASASSWTFIFSTSASATTCLAPLSESLAERTSLSAFLTRSFAAFNSCSAVAI